ncbi:translesion DNA synthesis-associated protein ImuA [Bowmanella denitrificans]|uniref:Translesion DNA synthesis-associated protein ImuA n=1 Tax=Bowmanella denitrificans TaxID=366582 RepID=A0ABN0WNX0_9ALTE
MNNLIDHLKNKGWVWQANFSPSLLTDKPGSLDELSQFIPGGLKEHALVEIHSQIGIGEVRLLLPRLAANGQDHRLLVWVAPPHKINGECLHQTGIDLSRVLILHPRDGKEALWAAEQCLKSGTCHSVLLWHGDIEVAQAKRLQQACQQGRAQLFLLRTRQSISQSLPVSLSLQLEAHAEGLQIKVTKCRGSWPPAPFILNMRQRWPKLCLPQPTQPSANVIPLHRAS